MTTTPSHKPRRIVTGLVLAGLAVGTAGLAWHHQRTTPKRFGTVAAGHLYRCGEITPTQLEHVVRTYGIRTVLSLLNPRSFCATGHVRGHPITTLSNEQMASAPKP